MWTETANFICNIYLVVPTGELTAKILAYHTLVAVVVVVIVLFFVVFVRLVSWFVVAVLNEFRLFCFVFSLISVYSSYDKQFFA